MQLLKDLNWVTLEHKSDIKAIFRKKKTKFFALYARHNARHVFISVSSFVIHLFIIYIFCQWVKQWDVAGGSVSWPGTFAIGVVLKSVFRSERGVTLEHMSDIKTTFRKEKTPILCIIRQRKCMVISLRQIELKKVLRIPFYTFIRHKRNGLG